MRSHGAEVLIVGVYVDDLIVTRSSIDGVEGFKTYVFTFHLKYTIFYITRILT